MLLVPLKCEADNSTHRFVSCPWSVTVDIDVEYSCIHCIYVHIYRYTSLALPSTKLSTLRLIGYTCVFTVDYTGVLFPPVLL